MNQEKANMVLKEEVCEIETRQCNKWFVVELNTSR